MTFRPTRPVLKLQIADALGYYKSLRKLSQAKIKNLTALIYILLGEFQAAQST